MRLLLAGVLCLTICVLISEDFHFTDTSPNGKLSKKDRMDLAIQQEFEATKDLSSQQVPRERLQEAYRIAERKRKRSSKRGAIANLNWEERGPDNVGGRTRALLFDRNDPSGETVWAAGVGGGLWKSNSISSNNPNWKLVNDQFENLAVTAIAQDPTSPNTMYFGTGEGWYNSDAIRGSGIWKTIDGGSSWNLLPESSDGAIKYIQKILIDTKGNLFVASLYGGLMKSSDGGNSFQTTLGWGTGGTSEYRAADIALAANGDLFVSMGIFSTDGIYKSSDEGETWIKLSTGLPTADFQRIELACAPSDSNRVYALFQDKSSRECKFIYRSNDGGSTWTEIPAPDAYGMTSFTRNQAWYNLIIAVDPTSPDRLWLGGIDLHLSDDGGYTWRQVSQWYGGNGMQYVHADQHVIEFAPQHPDRIAFGNDGGVYLSTNGSNGSPTISARNQGYNITQLYSCALYQGNDQDFYLAGTQDNGTQVYQDLGLNSTIEITGGDGGFCHIDEEDPQIQITSYVYNYFFVTTDGWTSSSTHNFNSKGRFINPSDYDSRLKILYAGHDGGKYFRVSDITGTPNGEEIDIQEFNGGKITHVMVSPNVEGRVYFGLDNGMVVKVDSAHSASPASVHINNNYEDRFGVEVVQGVGSVSCVAIEEGNEDHLLITYSNYGAMSIWESQDGGENWLDQEGDLPDMPVRWAMFNPYDANQAILATEVGVWSCDNLSESLPDWEPSNSGLANVRTDMLQIRPDGQVIAATHGRGLYSSFFPVPIIPSVISVVGDSLLNLSEGSLSGTQGCIAYQDYLLKLGIDKAPGEDILMEVIIEGGTNADDFDFEFPNGNIVTFTAEDTAEVNFPIRIYADQNVEGTEEIILRGGLPDGSPAESKVRFEIALEDSSVVPHAGTHQISNTLLSYATQSLGPKATVFFIDSTNQLLAKIVNKSQHDFGCTTVQLNNNSIQASNNQWLHLTGKTYVISAEHPSNDSLFELTLYYDQKQILTWEYLHGYSYYTHANLIHAGNPGADFRLLDSISVANLDASILNRGRYGVHYAPSATFKSFGSFTLGLIPASTSSSSEFSLSIRPISTEVQIMLELINQANISYYQLEVARGEQAYKPFKRLLPGISRFKKQSQQLSDPEAIHGWNHYRLIAIDDNGNQLSTIKRSIFLDTRKAWEIRNDPTAGSINIYPPQNFEGKYSLSLLDTKGSALAIRLGIGSALVEWDLGSINLTKGIYFVKIEAGGEVMLEKVLVE